jgi:hypothetical protein
MYDRKRTGKVTHPEKIFSSHSIQHILSFVKRPHSLRSDAENRSIQTVMLDEAAF